MNPNGPGSRLEAAIHGITTAPTEIALAQALTQHAVAVSGADVAWLVEKSAERAEVIAEFARPGTGIPPAAPIGTVADLDLDDVTRTRPIDMSSPAGPTTVFVVAEGDPMTLLVVAGSCGGESREQLMLLTEIASATAERIQADHALQEHADHIRRVGAQLLALGSASLERADPPEASEPSDELPATDDLTDREREILGIVTSGASNADIAVQLTVSVETVKTHVKHILRKLNAANRSELIAMFGAASTEQVRDSSPPPARAPHPDRR